MEWQVITSMQNGPHFVKHCVYSRHRARVIVCDDNVGRRQCSQQLVRLLNVAAVHSAVSRQVASVMYVYNPSWTSRRLVSGCTAALHAQIRQIISLSVIRRHRRIVSDSWAARGIWCGVSAEIKSRREISSHCPATLRSLSFYLFLLLSKPS